MNSIPPKYDIFYTKPKLTIIYFYFLITYEVCKKRKYCNRMSEKKKILSFWQMFMIFMS